MTIPNSVTSIKSGTFYECSSLKSVTIPNGVTKIIMYAFAECRELTSVIIPSSVTFIGNYAFFHCGLASVTSLNTIPPEIGMNTFTIYHDATLYVPVGCKDTYLSHPIWKYFAKVEEIDASNINYTLSEKVDEKNKYYNLNGQRVHNPKNGIYIVNGKKVIIKPKSVVRLNFSHF